MSTLRKKCYEFLCNKQKIGLLSNDLSVETDNIIESLTKEKEVFKKINKDAKI